MIKSNFNSVDIVRKVKHLKSEKSFANSTVKIKLEEKMGLASYSMGKTWFSQRVVYPILFQI